MSIAKPLALIAILFAALLWLVSPSYSQSMCGPYKDFVAAIEGSRYGETSTGKGLSGAGQIVIEMFVGKETFTILATTPATGRTCIIAAGKSWIEAHPKIPGEDL